MDKDALVEGIAANVLVMLPKAKTIFKDTYAKRPELNLRGIQIVILNIIRHEGPISMGQLSSMVAIAKANTTPLVADLIAKGILYRKRYERDRRVILIDLTEKGRAIQEEIQQQNIALLKDKLSTCRPEDLNKLNEVILTLSSLFDRWLEPSDPIQRIEPEG